MRAFTRTTLAALAALLIASAHTSAQEEAAGAGFKLTPEREGFVALMPAPPTTRDMSIEASGFKVAGRAYGATSGGGATYIVIALDFPKELVERMAAADKGYVSARFGSEGAYLDRIAEVAWDTLVRPEYDRLKKKLLNDFYPVMSYRREFHVGESPAREYLVKLRRAGGPVYVCADGPRGYVVAALGPASESAQLTRFVESFSPKAPAPATPEKPPSTVEGGGGPGRGGGIGGGEFGGLGGIAGEVDYTRTFPQRQVGQKAILLDKPDPGYTEPARKFNVTGVVRLRAVLNRTGEVTNILVIKGLPHGLTVRAIDAARGIKFKPAQKDGRAVSQYVTLDYNFNIY